MFDRRWLWMASPLINRPTRRTRRRYLLAGAAAGGLTAIVARLFMRSISDDPVFTVPGTTLIFLVFGGLGACAALALLWRQLGSPRPRLVQQLVGFAPLLLMGPFMPLFA